MVGDSWSGLAGSWWLTLSSSVLVKDFNTLSLAGRLREKDTPVSSAGCSAAKGLAALLQSNTKDTRDSQSADLQCPSSALY